MKEIKFKLVLDLKETCPRIVGFEKWYEGCWSDDGWRAKPCWLYSKDGEFWNPQPIPHNKKLQFTGLKDKNGKEIYEGDIVRAVWDIGERDEVIFWLPQTTKFCQLGIRMHEAHKTNWIALSNYSKTPGCGRAEIIGNIYENPELLPQKREGEECSHLKEENECDKAT